MIIHYFNQLKSFKSNRFIMLLKLFLFLNLFAHSHII